MDKDVVIKVDNVTKTYRLGALNRGSFIAEFQGFMARMRRKEDPNKMIETEMPDGDGVSMQQDGITTFNALENVSFEVKKGEAIGIIGANGAGKSTLLKIISSITTPTKGSVTTTGHIASMLEVGTGFHPDMTGRENIYMNGAILGMPREAIDAVVDDIIEFSEVAEFIDTPVKRYSSGMYVKLAFAVSSHLNSDILIVDEVLAVGDVRFQAKCIQKMNQIVKSEARTVLSVSHNMDTVRRLCTRGIVLDRGRMVLDAPVDKAISSYLNGLGNWIEKENIVFESKFPIVQNTVTEPTKSGHLVKCVAMAVQGGGDAVCRSGEKIGFCLTWKEEGVPTEYRMRLSVRNSFNAGIVGICVSQPFKAKNIGGLNETNFSLDTTNIVPGDYFFVIEIYCNEDLKAQTYESPQNITDRTYFKVSGWDNPTTWFDRSWNSVRLADATVDD